MGGSVRQKSVIIIKKEAKRQAERKKDFFLLFLFWSAERVEAKNPSFIQKEKAEILHKMRISAE